MLVTELNDVLRGHRPDAVDGVELFDGRGAEADRPLLRRRRQPPRRRAGTALGNHHLLAIGEPRGEVDRFELCLAGRPRRRAATASSTLLPAGSR